MLILILTLITVFILSILFQLNKGFDKILDSLIFKIFQTPFNRWILRGGAAACFVVIQGFLSFMNAQSCTVNIAGSSTFCSGTTSTLTANPTGGSNYLYKWNTGETTPSINVTTQGTYTVTVTNQIIGGGTNIIPNGNFSSGNSGFSSDYYYAASNGTARDYTVTNNTQVWNNLLYWAYNACTDRTSTSDNMHFLARGSSNTAHRAWYVTVPVTPNTVYDLSAWAAGGTFSLLSSQYALVQLEVNGTLLGSSVRMTGPCNWQNLTTTWNSGSNTVATIAVRDLNSSISSDNNFLLDDISMIPRTTIGCVVTSSKNITEIPISQAQAGIDLNQCSDNTFTMAANTPASGIGSWSVVSGTASITSVNSPNTAVTLSTSSATLRWTITGGTCTTSDDIVLTNSTGSAGLFCNCGPIFATTYGGTSTAFSNQIRQLNNGDGTYSVQVGNNLTHISVAIALDSRYQRMYYVPISDGGNVYSTTTPYVYFMNNSGTVINTNILLPGTNNYNRAGYNPINNNVYFVSSDGTNWVRYSPTAAGTGGTIQQYSNISYSPASAPVISSTNGGGDIVFDAEGFAYLVTNAGHFYKVTFNNATSSVSLTYLGQMDLSMTQVASLAFSSDGKLYAAGNGNNVYYINLQTLEETQVNTSSTAGSGDFSSCNFPYIRPELNAFKSFKKISGSSGTNIQTNDIVEYTINIQNIGDISAGNVKFYDNIPAGTSYIAGSTLLNGSTVSDISGVMPFAVSGGSFINSYDQAAQSGAVSPVPYSATIKFRVRVTSLGDVVRNSGTITFGDNNQIVLTNSVEFDVCYPITGITAGSSPFCQGQNTTLTANDEGTYLWNTGETTRSITISTAGTYRVTVTQPSDGAGGNIVVNGDFSAGNTGFSTDYVNGSSGWGVYNVSPQANSLFTFALPCPDHDSRTNNMFVADGSDVVGKRVWYQTVPVTPNTMYDLSAWGQSIINFNPSKLYFTINGTKVGSTSTLAALDCAWQQFTAEWFSGSNTSVTLAIMNENYDGSGNDFAIDDISMRPRTSASCPKIGSITISVIIPTPASSGADTLAQCNNSTFNIIGNAPNAGETGRWELLSGLAVIASPTSATTTATVLPGTSAVVRWVIDKNGCLSTDTKTLVNNLNSVGGTISPATQTICANQGNFQTTPSVSGIVGSVIRWEYQAPSSSTWVNWGGAGSTTAPANCCATTVGTWKVRAIIQNGVCASTTSTTADIVVVSDPTVSVSAVYTTLCSGQTAALTANVSNGTGTTSYQWQSSTDNVTFTNISGATSATYTSGILSSNIYYRVVVNQTGTNCDAVTSSAQLITVVSTPTANAGADQTHCNTSFTMAANTPSAGIGTWSVVNGTANIISPNSPSTAVTLTSATATLRWTIVVNGACSSSDDVIITMAQPITITTNPPSITECIGGSQTLGIAFYGGAGTITYQWQSSSDNSTWTNISGATASTYTPPTTIIGTVYYRIIINASEISCSQGISGSGSVAVVADPSVSINVTNATVCSGGTSILTATVSNGTGTNSYQWQSSADGVTWNNIPGATADTYSTPALTSTTYYRVQATQTGNGCGATTSASTTITVVAGASISVTTSNATICDGGTSTLTANISNGTGTPTYQWQSSNDNITFNNITGATSANYTTAALTTTTYYRVVVNLSGSGCGASTSASSTITVVADPSVSVSVSNATICNSGTSTLTANVSNGTGTTSYQWQSSTDNVTFNNIAGANAANYTTAVLTATTYYRVVVNQSGSGCGVATSATSTITVVADPTVSVSVSNATICNGGTSTLTANVSNGTGTTSYQWQSSTDNITFNNIAGANAANYTTAVLTATTYYRVVVNQSGSGCGTATSATSTITVVADPIVSVSVSNATICNGGTSTLTANVSNGTGTTSYQWQSSTDNITFNNIAGANAANYTTTALTATTYYRVIVNQSGIGCGSQTSAPSIITVVADPSVSVGVSNSTVCPNNVTTLTSTILNGTGAISYQWQSSTDSLTWTNISGATNNTYTPSTSSLGQMYYRVTVTMSGNNCNTTSSYATIVRVINCSTTTCDNPLTPALNFNVFVRQGVTLATGDIEGGLALGGDLTLNGTYNIALKSPGTYKAGSDVSESALIIGGRINYTAGNGVNVLQGGLMKLGNTAGSTIFNTGNTRVTPSTFDANPKVVLSVAQPSANVTASSGIDFNTAFTTLQQNANTLSSMAQNVTLANIGGGNMGITLANNTVNVLNLTGAQLNSYSQLTFNNKPNANRSLIINVNASGTFNWNIWNTAGIGDADGTYIIYNFYNTTTLNINNAAPVYGSLLAPSANILKNGSGNINGQVIANSYSTSAGEMHYYSFDAPINELCCALLTVNVSLNNGTVCTGGNAILTATTANATSSLSYQWQSSPNGTTWTNITGATSLSYTTPALTTTTYYRIIVTQNGCSAPLNSSASIVNVVADPSVSVSPTSATVCDGGATTLMASVSNGTGSSSYQWQSSTDNITFTNITGATSANYTTPSLNITTYYRIIVSQTGNGCGTTTSATTTITVVQDPSVSITVAGGNSTICVGGSTTLNAAVSNGTGTTTYQWQSSTDNITFNNISGATNANYTTSALTTTTYYRVLVNQSGNGCGSATSSTTTITVVPAPTVSVTADNATICSGGNATLTATVSGGTGSVTYQWLSSTDNVTFNNIAGATSATYNTGALTANRYYKVSINQAGNGCGSATSATPTTITVVPAPTVSVTADNATICSGGNATLTATVSGGTGSVTYQWLSSTDNVSFNNIAGATSATYNTGALTANRFYKVSINQAGNGCGSATSATATSITVVPAPTVSVTADNATICSGGNATLTATVSGGTGSVTYQWLSSTDNVSFNNIAGATSATYNTGALSANRYYKVTINQAGNGCGSATSATATSITVVPAPTVSVTADNATICSGGNATLTATVSGGTGSVTYQWLSSTDNVSFNNIAGATSATYNTGALTANRYYKVSINQSGNGCGSATSTTATSITVVPAPTVSVTADNATICSGGNATLTATVSGGTGSVSYQWLSSTDNVSFNNIAGATSATYNTGALSANRFYKVSINQAGNGCGSATSTTATSITVVTAPTVSVTADNATICSGGNATLTATVSGGTGSVSYQWLSSTDNVSFNNIAGATSATYNTGALNANRFYKVTINQAGNGCGSATSATATSITVVPAPTVSVTADNATICSGGNATLTATVSGGTGSVTYQWLSSTDNVSFNNIAGANSATYNTGALTANRFYKVSINQAGNGCGSATSATATSITVVPAPTVSVTADNATICSGGNANLTATVSGGTGSVSYQWLSSTDNVSFNNIAGATSATYNTGALSANRFYKVSINQAGNGCGSATSATPTTITVVPAPTVSVSADNATICSGGNATLTATVSGGTGSVTYQWLSSTDNVSFNNIAGATSATYNTGALTANRFYKVTINQAGNGCGSATSATPTTITVVPAPTVSVTADNATICSGGNATLTATVSGGTGSVTYQWLSSTDNVSFNNIAGATSASYNTGALTANRFYKVTINQAGNGCGSATSTTATSITVVPAPTVSVTADNATICSGGNATLTATVSGGTGSVTYQWLSSTDNVTFNNIAGATSASYNTGALTANRFYKVTINQAGNGCGSATSATPTTITVVPAPTVSVTADNATICSGGNATLTATVSGGTGSVSYQWLSSTDNVSFNNIAGATSATYNTGALNANRFYKVTINQAGNGCGSATSATPTTITVVPAPTVSVTADNATICSGGNATLTATVSGGTGSVTYQWLSSTDNVSFNNIAGANSATYNTGALTANRFYKVTINQAGNGCGSATSATPTSITVVPAPTVSVTADNATICSGGNATLTATVSGGTGSVTYQWLSSTDNVTFNNISGATSATYNTGALTANRFYKVSINQAGNGCGSATSATATSITVVPAPTVSVTADNATICSGGNANLTATVSGGTGSVTYQWLSSTDNVSFNNIAGANSATYNTGALTANRFYKVTINQAGNGCGSATSATPTTITVVPAPRVNIAATEGVICSGGGTTLNAIVIGGTGTTTYQWLSSTDNVTFTNIVGATSAVYSTGVLTATRYYKVTINQSGNGCGSITTADATEVTVVPTPVVTVSANNSTVCSGGNATLTASILGGAGTATYQWQSSTDNVTFNNISGATSATYNTGALAATRYYKVIVTLSGSGCGSVSPATNARITVVPAPTVTISASDLTLCTGSSAVLTANITGGTGTTTLQWQSSNDGVSFTNITGETNPTYTTPVLSSNAYYRVIATQSGNGCGSVTSATTALAVTAAPLANAGADLSQCSNVFTMAANAPTAGTGTWTIVNGTATIANPNSPTTTITVTSPTAILRWTITVNTTCEDFDDILLNVAEQLSISSAPNGFDECIGGNRQMGISTSGGTGFQNFQWQRSTDEITWGNINTATNSNYTPQSDTVGTLFYRVIVTPIGLGCNVATSGSARVRILPDPTITVVPADETICTGSSTRLSATVSNGTGTASFQWQNSTDGVAFSDISGATTAVYNTPALNTTTYYRLNVTQSGSGCAATTASNTTITVVPAPTANAGTDKNQCTNTFTMTANAPTAGTGTWTIVNGTATIANPNSATTDVTVTSTTATLRWTLSVNSTCSNSDEVVLTVVPNISITAQPTPVTECVGGTLPLVITTEGGVGTLVYQWQSSTDNSIWSDISGATSATYTPSSATAGTTYYRVIVRSSLGNCSQVTSNSTAVDIIAKPVINVTAASTTVCNGASGIQLNATVTGGVDCTIQWQNSINAGGTWLDIPGATGNTYSTSVLDKTTKYRVQLNCSGNGCCN